MSFFTSAQERLFYRPAFFVSLFLHSVLLVGLFFSLPLPSPMDPHMRGIPVDIVAEVPGSAPAPSALRPKESILSPKKEISPPEKGLTQNNLESPTSAPAEKVQESVKEIPKENSVEKKAEKGIVSELPKKSNIVTPSPPAPQPSPAQPPLPAPMPIPKNAPLGETPPAPKGETEAVSPAVPVPSRPTEKTSREKMKKEESKNEVSKNPSLRELKTGKETSSTNIKLDKKTPEKGSAKLKEEKLSSTLPMRPKNKVPLKLDEIAQYLQKEEKEEKETDSAAQNTIDSPSQPRRDSPSSSREGEKSKMSSQAEGELNEFIFEKYKQCWDQTRPPGQEEGGDYVVRLEIEYNMDGSLVQMPRLLNPSSDPRQAQLGESVLRAVRLCDPLSVPEKFAPYYGQWKKRRISFDPKLLGGE